MQRLRQSMALWKAGQASKLRRCHGKLWQGKHVLRRLRSGPSYTGQKSSGSY